MDSTVLNTTKKLLGIAPDDDSFDTDILIFINSAVGVLNQLGALVDGSQTIDENSEWSSLATGTQDLKLVRSYIYLKVRLAFDPPQNSFVTDAIEKQIMEMGWRIQVQEDYPTFPEEENDDDDE